MRGLINMWDIFNIEKGTISYILFLFFIYLHVYNFQSIALR